MQIMKEIDRSKVFIFLASKDSAVSAWCKDEFEHALDKRKPILTIFIEDPDPCIALMPMRMADYTRSHNYLQFPGGTINCKDFAEVCGQLGELLRPPWRLLAAAFAVLVLVIAGLGFYIATLNNDPEISIQSANAQAIKGSIKPDFLCSDLFRIVVYVKIKGDKWYIQPDSQGVSANTDTCEWEVYPGRNWNKIDEIAVHLAPVATTGYSTQFSFNTTCPPLKDTLAWHCFKP